MLHDVVPVPTRYTINMFDIYVVFLLFPGKIKRTAYEKQAEEKRRGEVKISFWCPFFASSGISVIFTACLN